MATPAVPDSTVTPPNAQAQVAALAAQDAAKGQVPVYTFDANAPPEEKAAQPAKGEEKLKSKNDTAGMGGIGASGGAAESAPCADTSAEVPVDTGKANVLPTITIEDVDRLDEVDEPLTPLQEQPPGAMPAGPAPVIPDWYKVGWRAIAGIDEPAVSEGEAKDKTVLDAFLKEQFYGEWYHNAALILVVCFNWFILRVRRLTCFPGCHCHAFPDPLPLWLGLAVHPPRVLQHLLLHVHVPRAEPRPR